MEHRVSDPSSPTRFVHGVNGNVPSAVTANRMVFRIFVGAIPAIQGAAFVPVLHVLRGSIVPMRV